MCFRERDDSDAIKQFKKSKSKASGVWLLAVRVSGSSLDQALNAACAWLKDLFYAFCGFKMLCEIARLAFIS